MARKARAPNWPLELIPMKIRHNGTSLAHIADKSFVERATTVLLLGLLWSGLAACILGALLYDIAYWFEGS
jgi:lambda repressor-like predicted transcriptional regulator